MPRTIINSCGLYIRFGSGSFARQRRLNLTLSIQSTNLEVRSAQMRQIWRLLTLQWAAVSDVSPTVPDLAEGYERVCLSSFMQNLLGPVATNKTDGATALTKVALKSFREFVYGYQRNIGQKGSNSPGQDRKSPRSPLTVQELSTSIKNFAWHVLHAREAMIHIGNLIARLITVIFKNREFTSVSQLQETAVSAVDSLLKMLDASSIRISANIRQHIRSGSPYDLNMYWFAANGLSRFCYRGLHSHSLVL